MKKVPLKEILFSPAQKLLPLLLLPFIASQPAGSEPAKPGAAKPTNLKPTAAKAAAASTGRPAGTTAKPSASAGTGAEPVKRGPMVKGDVLKQVSDWRGGMKMELCSLGARWITGDVVILMLPDKKAYFINHATKTYAPVNKKTWTKSLGIVSTDTGPEKVTRLPDETLAGIRCNHYEVVKLVEEKNFLADYENGGKPTAKKAPAKKEYRFRYRQYLWASKDFPVSKEFLSECAAVCLLPGAYGLPLKVMRADEDKVSLKDKKKWKVYLDTLKIERGVMLDGANFKLPAKEQGYKLAKSELEVMMGDDDMLEDL